MAEVLANGLAAQRSSGEGKKLASEDDARRAQSLKLMVLWTLAIGTLGLVSLIVLEPQSLARRGGSIAVLWLGAGAVLGLSHRGFTRAASALLIALLIVLVTQRAFLLGGIHAPLAPGFVVFAMMASALLGARAGAFATLACLACAAVLVVADVAGALPPVAERFSSIGLWLYLAMFMGLALVVQRLIARELGASLERMRAELLERQRAQRRLSLALDAGRIAIWEQDPETRHLHGDARLFELYGLPPREDGLLAWETWRSIVHPDDRSEVDARFSDLLRGVPQVSAEFRATWPDGTLRHVHGSAALLTDEQGATARFVGVNVDITDLKRAQLKEQQLVRELRERIKELKLLHAAARLMQRGRELQLRELLRELIALIPSGWTHSHCCEVRVVCGDVVMTSAAFRSTAWAQVARFSTSEGAGCIEVVYTEPQPQADEGPFLTEERTVLDSLSEMLASHIELRRYQRGLEELVGMRTAELSASRDAAQSASRVKSAFLANMSHEIRTPLNAILGYAQLLAGDAALSEAQRRQVEIIRASGDHLFGMINDVLEMSRIEAGRTVVAQQPFDLPALIEQVRSMFAMEITSRGLSLEIELDGLAVRGVQADPGKVRQVLINLVGNAVKFTERGSIRIHASSRPSGQGACLVAVAVEDTGCGIAKEEQARIFEAFTQAERGGHKGGTGLGLTISRNFARLLGGDLSVTSVPGQGSSFRFTFVAKVASEEQLAALDQGKLMLGLGPLAGERKVPIVAPVAKPAPLHDIGGLPAELIKELREAAEQARATRLVQLAERVALVSPQAASTIRALAREYRYAELLHALKEASHGA